MALRPDLTTAVSGTQTIVVRATADRVARLAFSGNALRIDEASANCVAIYVHSDRNAIIFILPRSLRTGQSKWVHER